MSQISFDVIIEHERASMGAPQQERIVWVMIPWGRIAKSGFAMRMMPK